MNNVIPFAAGPSPQLDMINRSITVRAVRAVSLESIRGARRDAKSANAAPAGSNERQEAAERVRLRLDAISGCIGSLHNHREVEWLVSSSSC